ncbi:hypothetical protein N9164_12505, partial [Draconibacterium sp.]|nr:hypothetical protein [Draconibacterium sp.]
KYIVDTIVGAATAVGGFFADMGKAFGELFASLGESIANMAVAFGGAIADAAGKFGEFIASIGGWFVEAFGKLGDHFATMGEKMGKWFSESVIDPVVDFFKTIGNALISALNFVIKGLNHIPLVDIPQIPHFADGGFVPGNKGQAVPAIVHGGELVLNQGQQSNLSEALEAGGGVTVEKLVIEGKQSTGETVDAVYMALEQLQRQGRASGFGLAGV